MISHDVNHKTIRFTISLLEQAGVYDTYMTVLLQAKIKSKKVARLGR